MNVAPQIWARAFITRAATAWLDSQIPQLKEKLPTGQLPASAGDVLPGLQVLYLGFNEINNTLDSAWGSGSSWGQMQRLSLQDNYFYGTLPTAWADADYWPQLTSLNISNNHLQGGLPGIQLPCPSKTCPKLPACEVLTAYDLNEQVGLQS